MPISTVRLPFLVNSGIQNAGQTCSAASRILVEQGVYDDVAGRMAEAYRALRVGPALDDPDVGPLISARQKEIVAGYLGRGGEVLAEARRCPAPCRPAAITSRRACSSGIAPDHPLAQEEIFGPVQVLIPFRDEAEASPSPTARDTASSPRSGAATARARCGLRARSGPVRSSSTITARAAGWNSPSAGAAGPGTGGKRGSRR